MDGRSTIPIEELGLFLRGAIVAESGGPIKKDGKPTERVLVVVEIAFGTGLAKWFRFIGLEDCPNWLDSSEFVDIPRFGQLKPIHLKVRKIQPKEGILEIWDAEIVS